MNSRYCSNEQGKEVRKLQRGEQVKAKPKAENFESVTGENHHSATLRNAAIPLFKTPFMLGKSFTPN